MFAASVDSARISAAIECSPVANAFVHAVVRVNLSQWDQEEVDVIESERTVGLGNQLLRIIFSWRRVVS